MSRQPWQDHQPHLYQERQDEGDEAWCGACERPVHETCVACGIDTGPQSDLPA